jgi:Ni2+-binding GTPase involved in maturation of urease and hydrogenase
VKIATFSGPPSSGKTSVVLKTARYFREKGRKPGVVKFDCLSSDDGQTYKEHGIPALTGISGIVCPDHFYVSNMLECIAWGEERGLDVLIIESAGLCNRCAPHLKNASAVCVMDNLMGLRTPIKVGPMLKRADIVAVTKGDVVSQAEREVFAYYVMQANPNATVLHVNGITGQGCAELSEMIDREDLSARELKLRFSMPAAICSYCLGERNIREEYSLSTIRTLERSPEDGKGAT